MNNKITFPELVDLVAQKANTSKRMSEVFLKEFFATISTAMIEGESVKIKGLGTFKVTDVKERSTRSVNDGGVITIPVHKKITFTPDAAMARTINMPFEHFTTVTLEDEVTDAQLEEIDNEVKSAVPETDDVSGDVAPIVEEQQPEEPQVAEEPVTPPAFVMTPPAFKKQHEEEPPAEQVATVPPAIPVTEKQPAKPATVMPVTPPAVPQPIPEPVPESIPELTPEPTPENEEAGDEVPAVDGRVSRRSWWWGFAVGALCMLLLASIVGVVSRCDSKTDEQTMVVPADSTANDTDTITEAGKVAQQQVAVVTDTVTDKKEDWPVNIAKRHYGHEVFWVYIYQENKDKLDDYQRVPTGTILVIPPAEKYGIDANDPTSVKKAQEEANRAYLETLK